MLIGVVLGMAIGWALGYLGLPYFQHDAAFAIGFATCVAVTVVIWLLVSRKVRRRYAWLAGVLGILAAGAVSGWWIAGKRAALQADLDRQQQLVQQQAALIQAEKNAGQMQVLADLMGRVQDELQERSDGTLSTTTISKIAALSHALPPYISAAGATGEVRARSPERGQLLLALQAMKLDTETWDLILRDSRFSGADLRGAALSNAYLARADLVGADFRDADLTGADLSIADLTEAGMWGARLNGADLHRAVLKRAMLAWAELYDANLDSTKLEEANMSNARMKRSSIRNATAKWVDLRGADLQHAVLTNADLTGAKLQRTRLHQADCTHANLTLARLRETDLSETVLQQVAVFEADWIEKLEQWQVVGAAAISQTYRLVEDPSAPANLRLVAQEEDGIR